MKQHDGDRAPVSEGAALRARDSTTAESKASARQARWRRFSDWPLRLKLALLLVLASLVPLVVAAIVDIRQARDESVVEQGARLAARGDQLAREVDMFHRGYQRSAKRLASLPGVIAFSDSADDLHQTLAVWPASTSEIRGVGILDLTGVVRLSSETPLRGKNFASFSYVQEALRGQSVISNVHLAGPEVGRAPTIAYLAPVRGPNGAQIAVVAIWVRATALWDLAKSSNGLAGPDSFAVMFDADGVRIAHTYSDEIVFHPSGPLNPETIEAAVAEERFGDRTRELLADVRAFPEQFDRARSGSAPDGAMFRGFAPANRKWNYGVGRRLETVPWTLFYMIPEESLDAPIAAMTRQKTGFAGAIILLALLAGALLATVVLRPIVALAKATEALASGDLSARVQPGGRDEVGRLGTSFDAMAARIEGQDKLLRGARDDLEARVKQRTAELSASEESLSITLDSIGDAVIATDAEGQVVRMNPVAEKLTGWPSSEASGRSLDEVFHIINEESRAVVESPVAHVLREGVVVGLANHTALIARDGSERPIADSGAPIRDAEGVIRGVVLVFRDQTGEREAEGERERMADRLRVLAEASHDFSAATQDHDHLLATVARRLAEVVADLCIVLIASPDESELSIAAIHAPDANAVRLARELFSEPLLLDRHPLARRVHDSGEPFVALKLDLEQLRANTTPKYFEAARAIGMHSLVMVALRVHDRSFGQLVLVRYRPSSPPFAETDLDLARSLAHHASLAIANARSYGAERSAVERYRLMFDSNPQPMFVVDAATLAFVEVNAAAVRQYGYTREEFLTMKGSDLWPAEDVVKNRAAMSRLPPESSIRGRHQLKDGTIRDVEVRAHVLSFNGQPCRLVLVNDVTERLRAEQARVVAETANRHLQEQREADARALGEANARREADKRDILERQRAEEALRRAKEAAEAATTELEAFSYSVAHDLRAPLRGMNGFAQLLLDAYADKVDVEGQDWLQEIVLNAEKMGKLIDALLSLARLTSSELHPEMVDLSSIVRASFEVLLAAEPGRTVELVVEDHLMAELDPVLARALIDNLLANALKFTNKVPFARIELGAAEKNGARAFFLRDNGAGFDMAFAEKLFAPFQRLHTAAEFPGTGIGLATVQRIVRRHGGRVWAESVVNGGATFHFAFPARTSGAPP